MSDSDAPSIKIYVSHHKKYWCCKNDILTPIHVGKKLSSVVLPFETDDSGENISHKNKILSELTGMYWVWKNSTPSDYVGFCHYRRYFSFKQPFPLNLKLKLLKNGFVHQIKSDDQTSIKNLGITDSALISKIVSQYDIILPYKTCFRNLRKGKPKMSIGFHYRLYHPAEDLALLVKSIKETYPEINNEVDEYFEKNNSINLFTMFIMKHELFDQYMQFMFNILECVEKKIILENRDNYQSRALAFMGERLLSLFILKVKKTKNLKIKELPVILINHK